MIGQYRALLPGNAVAALLIVAAHKLRVPAERRIAPVLPIDLRQRQCCCHHGDTVAFHPLAQHEIRTVLPDKADQPRIGKIAAHVVLKIIAQEALPAAAGAEGGNVAALPHRHLQHRKPVQRCAFSCRQTADGAESAVQEDRRIREALSRIVLNRSPQLLAVQDQTSREAALAVGHLVVQLEISRREGVLVPHVQPGGLPVIENVGAGRVLTVRQLLQIPGKALAALHRIDVVLCADLQTAVIPIRGAHIDIICFIHRLG